MFRISNKNKRTIVFITYTKQKWYHNQTKTVAWFLPNIGHRTESDWTPDAIRLNAERNLIGRRTQSDWAVDGIRSDCVRVTVRKA